MRRSGSSTRPIGRRDSDSSPAKVLAKAWLPAIAEIYGGMPDAPAVTTLVFTEQDGRTTLTTLVQHEKKEHRDAHINSGMEAGMQDAMDLLEQLAISLA
jgi:uncharacterized protein YndB with AHSA1/START domain